MSTPIFPIRFKSFSEMPCRGLLHPLASICMAWLAFDFFIEFPPDGSGVGDDVCDCSRTAGGVADAFDIDVIDGEASEGSILIKVCSVTTTVVGGI